MKNFIPPSKSLINDYARGRITSKPDADYSPTKEGKRLV